ncbi:MAG: hypothetical protein JJ896_03340 [Rhodothermales bacterium]|nr:hypothetical protein [Rhodothermales bacterium]MBO6778668.1 hypothetical protein [Rhodothermales bacterium]
MERTRSASPVTTDEGLAADEIELAGVADDSASDGQFDPAEAKAIWSIASRLQAEASRRLDERSRVIAESSGTPSQSFSLDEIRHIGDEAGINAQFIDLAVRQHAAQKLDVGAPSPEQVALAERLLGSNEEQISISRVIHADRESVLKAVEDIFTSERYNLQLVEAIGDPRNLADSTLIFRVPTSEIMTAAGGINSFAYAMSHSTLNRMTATLHEIDAERTEVSLQVDLSASKWRSFRVGGWISGGMAAFTALMTALIAANKSAMGWVGIAGLTASISAAVGLAFGWATGWGYRYGLRKGKQAMQDLLGAVDIEARTGGFGRR